MTIRSLSDINAAFDAGRWHLQRFLKNAGTAHGLHWADPTFASGQPAYDAHVGTAATFTPCVATKNDAIWFPGIEAGMERYLASVTMWSNQSTFNGPGSVVLFDLLGYYPLIDGDSVDSQAFDNTQLLPRYATGEGVQAVFVAHVAPAIQAGVATINLTTSDGEARSVTLAVPNNGINLVCSGQDGTNTAVVGSLGIPLGSGAKGIRRIDSLTYTTPPGGLHVIYMIRQLGTIILGDNLVAAEKEFALRDGWRLPRIYDGAWLGWFDRIGSGTSRTVNWYGNFQFCWG